MTQPTPFLGESGEFDRSGAFAGSALDTAEINGTATTVYLGISGDGCASVAAETIIWSSFGLSSDRHLVAAANNRLVVPPRRGIKPPTRSEAA